MPSNLRNEAEIRGIIFLIAATGRDRLVVMQPLHAESEIVRTISKSWRASSKLIRIIWY